MRQGDFTDLAKDYVNRPGYSEPALRCLMRYVGADRDGVRVADVGAGTGKLTEHLLGLGLRGTAVEPNDAMRAEGVRLYGEQTAFEWRRGSAEETTLPSGSSRWLLMASSFHWTDQPRALAEFHRVLEPGGFFTALWNPRDLESNELQQRIDARIRAIVPELKRVSSGSKAYTEGLEQRLVESGLFGDLVFVEAPHEVVMTRDRYIGVWRSVNDIQAQAGDRWPAVLDAIEQEVASMETVTVHYRTRAWTVQARER